MQTLKNNRLIKALLRQPVDRTPIWFMRQAGRYLPEFREMRAKEPSFMKFCQRPEWACEVTLQPLRRFDLDAAIIFSDILTVPHAMGAKLEILPGEGPVVYEPIRTQAQVDQLQIPDVQQSLGYVFEAIERVVDQLAGTVPLIGFAGSPWTLACYLIEGKSSKTFQTAKTLLYREPAVVTALLERLTTVTIAYLNAQIQAGARVIMLFDTWGGLLNTAAYEQFSLHYLTKIANGLTRVVNGEKIPVIFFTKGGSAWLEKIAKSGCDAVGVDWTIDIGKARQIVKDEVALQGNLDPALLFADPKTIESAVKSILQSYGKAPGHVFNLGHGIDPATPIEGVEAMINAVINS